MPLLSREQKRASIAIPKCSSILDIKQNYNEPAKILCGEKWITSACLKCAGQKCIQYADEDISCMNFPEFSYERDLNVCPVGAISWDYSKEMPRIDNEKCFGCGLCASRCPIGAIYRKNNQMKISEPDLNYDIIPINQPNFAEHKRVIRGLEELAWNHHFQRENDEIFEQIYNRVAQFDGRSMASNVLIRNLIIALGCNCAISRTGDVYTRMDAVYSNPYCKGAVEIELGRDTLEASRGILDDIAVLHSRSGLDKNDNVALVVCLSFPNKRQGYFQVIKDIHNVLNMQIQTISLGALLLLVWNGVYACFDKKLFYVDFDNMSIRNIMEQRLFREVNISYGKLGILEPEK